MCVCVCVCVFECVCVCVCVCVCMCVCGNNLLRALVDFESLMLEHKVEHVLAIALHSHDIGTSLVLEWLDEQVRAVAHRARVGAVLHKRSELDRPTLREPEQRVQHNYDCQRQQCPE